jgi:hypothetical protein
VLSKAHDRRSLGLFEEEFSDAFFVQCRIRVRGGRNNHELCKLCNEPDMTKYIKINRLRRAGHIVRMENSRSVKKAFDARPEGTRKIERPKLRWEDGVIQDIRQGPGSEEVEECGYEGK